nr:hypothetical protein [Tanacetum cinerariifolium]
MVVKTNDLENPITSILIPTSKESKVVENDIVIAHGMFRINPFNTSREDKFVPINKARASVRTNPIIALKPPVITKQDCKNTANHDACVLKYVNDMNSCGNKHSANVLKIANQKKHKPDVTKPKKVGFKERLASPKPSKPRIHLT